MSYWLDVTLLAVMLVFGMRGYSSGFSKTVIGTAQFFACLLSGFLFSRKLSDLFYASSSWPMRLQMYLSSLLDGRFGAEYFIEDLVIIIVRVICFGIIWFGLWLTFQLIVYLFEKVNDLPILKQFNAAGGLLLGLIKGALVCVIVSNVVLMLGSAGINTLKQMCDASLLVPFLKLDFLWRHFAQNV